MKRCRECRRDYYDGTLRFCLDDGTTLLVDPASVDEPVTVRWSEVPAVSAGGLGDEAVTRASRNLLKRINLAE